MKKFTYKKGIMAKHDYEALAKTNVWGLDANDIKMIEESGDLYEPGNHWTFMKINTNKAKGEYEAVRDGLYMHVFGSLEDLMARANEKAFYEYDDKESAESQQETFVDANGNIREYGKGGSLYKKGGKTKEKMYRVDLYWKDNPKQKIEGYLIKQGEEDEDSDEDEDIFYYVESEKELKSLMNKNNPGEFVITKYTIEKFEKGGIPNNYAGKTTEQVWDEWTPKQRTHFIEDHYLCEKNLKQKRTADLQLVSSGESLMKYVELEWNKIPDVPLKFSLDSALYNHIMTGQYAEGGIIKTIWNFLTQKVYF